MIYDDYHHKGKPFKIQNFINDGFEKVCDVLSTKDKLWWYSNINKDLMYSEHRSWIYFLVIDDEIVKCGETGNPLGIVSSRTTFLKEAQPISGTKSRFGRLRSHPGDTDQYLRESVVPYILNGHNISLWAKKCPISSKQITIAGRPNQVSTTIHKDLEVMYLEHFKEHARMLPLFNKTTK